MKTELKPTKIPEHKPGAQGGKRDANRKEKTQQIADAALKLFLLQGVDKVTIDDIVKAAGVAKGKGPPTKPREGSSPGRAPC